MMHMQPAAPPPPAPRRAHPARKFLLVVLLAIAAFLAGFVPQWWQARGLRASLSRAEMQLQLANLHRQLGLASHEAQRNNYASATDAARFFFDDCTTLANTASFTSDPRTRVALLGYAAQRDEVMRLLAAGDPAARERLAGLYLTMHGVLARRGDAE